MYYNLMFRYDPRRKFNQWEWGEDFRFHRVITRLTDSRGQPIHQKSIQTAATLMDDFKDLENIYVVDDMADGVWVGECGGCPAASTALYRVFALQPTRLQMEVDWTDWE